MCKCSFMVNTKKRDFWVIGNICCLDLLNIVRLPSWFMFWSTAYEWPCFSTSSPKCDVFQCQTFSVIDEKIVFCCFIFYFPHYYWSWVSLCFIDTCIFLINCVFYLLSIFKNWVVPFFFLLSPSGILYIGY